MPKLDVPPFSAVGTMLPLLLFRSGYTSNTLSAPMLTVARRTSYEALRSVIHFGENVWSRGPNAFDAAVLYEVTWPKRCVRAIRPSLSSE